MFCDGSCCFAAYAPCHAMLYRKLTSTRPAETSHHPAAPAFAKTSRSKQLVVFSRHTCSFWSRL